MLELKKFTIKETKHERNIVPFFVQLLSEHHKLFDLKLYIFEPKARQYMNARANQDC